MSRARNQKNDYPVVGSARHSSEGCRRGVYKGPSSPFIDCETAKKIPDDFFPCDDIQSLMSSIVDAGYQLSCDTLTHPQFWQKEWNTCPICGSKPDYAEGVWVHLPEQ